MDTTEIKHPFPTVAALDADPAAGGTPDKFPLWAFPPQIREVSEDLARVYQIPVCLATMSGLGALSGAVGKWAEVRGAYRDKATRTNLYIIAGAERGTGKGNTSKLADPIRLRESIMQGESRARIANTKAQASMLRARIKKVETSGKGGADLQDMHIRLAELDREARRHIALTIDNATSEAAIATLQDNGEELFCVSSEAGAAIKVILGRYNKGSITDFDWLLSAYSGDAMNVIRVNRPPVTLESPCLSMLWMTQPSVLRELCANPEAQERGLTARALIFDTGARAQHDNGDNLAFTKGGQWKTLVDSFLDKRATGKPVVISCPPESSEVFRLFNNEAVDYGRAAFAGMGGELSRWRENAIKVAGLFALASGMDTITPDTANNACAVVKWAGFNYLSMLKAGLRERKREELDRLLYIIDEHGGEVALGDLKKSHGKDRKHIEGVMAAFPGRLKIDIRPQPKGKAGQPAQFLIALPKTNPTNPTNPPQHGNSVDSVDSFSGGGVETEGFDHA